MLPLGELDQAVLCLVAVQHFFIRRPALKCTLRNELYGDLKRPTSEDIDQVMSHDLRLHESERHVTCSGPKLVRQ